MSSLNPGSGRCCTGPTARVAITPGVGIPTRGPAKRSAVMGASQTSLPASGLALTGI
jgi:hypothetical protein